MTATLKSSDGTVVSANPSAPGTASSGNPAFTAGSGLCGKRVGMVVFSTYPADPRPRRAAEALLKEGMYLDFICEADEKLPKREKRDGLEIFRLPITHHRGGKLSYAYQYSAFILLSASLLAWRSLRRRYDLVYIHNMPDILVLSALVPRMFGAKVILDLHDPMPELMTTIFNLDKASLAVRLIGRLEKWSMALADRVVTVNIACKRIFGSRSCRPEKIEVVMNSPDEAIFPFRVPYAPIPKTPNDPFVIMYHGSLVERNGLDLAVSALAQVRESVPSVELRVYGRKTPFLEGVMDDVRARGLSESVHYLGAKRLEDLASAIDECDVGVIPNQQNAFTEINTPTRIFEYLATGKPVIAPSTPGIQDYFTAGSLFFFESGDAGDLARKMEYVYSHLSEATAVAERGQQVYLAHRWSEEKKKLVNVVTELLA
jgi:glycosyltransferase involved in cell wall biosynthesis